MTFTSALPVWAKNCEDELHIRLQFHTVVPKGGRGELRVATAGIYNVIINGEFVAYGPARAGRNHYRMDCLDISRYLKKDVNVIVIDAVNYRANSYYLISQPGFLQAEVEVDGKIISYTSSPTMKARFHTEYIRKVIRYSFQRPMLEAYRKRQEEESFLTGPFTGEEVELAVQPAKNIIERYAPYPQYETISCRPVAGGAADPAYRPKEYFQNRCVDQLDDALQGFAKSELEFDMSKECQEFAWSFEDGYKFSGCLKENEFCMFEFPYNATGMISMNVTCKEKTSLYLFFDEVLLDGDISLTRSGCFNIVKFELEPGCHNLRFFEVYTMKYLKIAAVGGSAAFDAPSLIEYKHPPVTCDLPVTQGDETLTLIKEAAIETYLQNAVDLFSDCPSRERAGWLCDSYFTARVDYLLNGNSRIEKGFLENFLHEERYETLPEGMLPMCYPADHPDRNYIANWTLWLVLELEEYEQRSHDSELIARYRRTVYNLLKFFQKYENKDGLLEKMDAWVFVEWSKANELTQDVNYPSNMLYSAALQAAGRLYHDDSLIEKSKKIAQAVREQSFNGTFFVDNAVYQDGRLVPTGECTEVCQYYAFFFSIATPESHKVLFETLVRDFGPDRKQNNKFPEVYFANAFPGNYLRLELLAKAGYLDKVLEEIKGYFTFMAKRTGTLWEMDSDIQSCNHGFASHVLYWLAQMK